MINYDLPVQSHINISVYNIMGQKVVRLEDKAMDAGSHSIVWDGKDESGSNVACGIYLYKLNLEGFESLRKIMLLR